VAWQKFSGEVDLGEGARMDGWLLRIPMDCVIELDIFFSLSGWTWFLLSI
jgi:hypothetical protein